MCRWPRACRGPSSRFALPGRDERLLSLELSAARGDWGKQNMTLSGKRVLVTGGTRGIGRATVEAFIAQGARVVLGGSTRASTDQALAELGTPVNLHGVAGDMGVVADCRRVVETALDMLGGLDVLLNNAGKAGLVTPITEVSEADFDATIAVNVRAVYFCTKFAVPALRWSRGNVVNVSSILGIRGSGSGDSVYSASKGAVIALTRDLAVELGPDIRVNCICPGAVDTDMLRDLGRHLGKGDVAAGYDVLTRNTPAKRVAQPAEIARAILYLASDAASFVTGSVQVVDGGATVVV